MRFLNINEISLLDEKRKMYTCFNHDEVLLCWYHAKNELNIENFFLITIDKHFDLTPLDSETKDSLDKFLTTSLDSSIHDLRDIIEKNFRPTNSSFIYAAMELGIVNDVLIISPDTSDSLKNDKYTDRRGIEHSLYYTTSPVNFWYPRGRGILNDISNPKKNEIRDKIVNSQIIIDFDLDYFTYFKDEKLFSISKDNFNRIFLNSYRGNSLSYLITDKSSVITVALEPLFCGGIKNCVRILDLFINDYFTELHILK